MLSQNPIVTTTAFEIALAIITCLGTGWIACDFFWTSIRSDEAAEKHFKRINVRRLLSYAAFGALAVVALLGWIW